MSPKAKAQLAREHLDRALPAVEAEDYTEAVTWLFVSLEAAIAAIADQHGVSTPPKHWRKVEIAEQLFGEGHISFDFGPVLRTLNDARKEAIYEGEEPDLGGQSLEDIAADVETAVGNRRGGVMSARPTSAASDASVIHRDAAAEVRLLIPPRLRAAHDLVCIRARETGAEALLLTGSTARGSRTSISDLDYHVIGVTIPHDDLPADLDIHVVSSVLVRTRLKEGDDFTQWSLRFGRVIFDSGIVNDSLRLIEQRGLWPDVSRKADQCIKSLKIAMAMVQSGDQDAAVEQVRTALTLAARWQLLAAHRFPLSRAELPTQLNEVGLSDLAVGLAATITGYPKLEELGEFLSVVQRLVDTTTVASVPPVRSHAA